jgi:hypothetical protein
MEGMCRFRWWNEGKLKKEQNFYIEDSIRGTIDYIYNETGQLTAQKGEGCFEDHPESFFFYDENDLLTMRVNHFTDGFSVIVSNYDSLGRLKEKLAFYDLDSIVDSKEIHHYNDASAYPKATEFISEDGRTSYHYYYDEFKNELYSIREGTTGAIREGHHYKYNKYGDVAEEFFPSQNRTRIYKYEYDERGNWIILYTFIDGVKKQTQIREIEYKSD